MQTSAGHRARFANEGTRAARKYDHSRKSGRRRPAEIWLERAPFGPPIETERQLRRDPGRSPDLRIDRAWRTFPDDYRPVAARRGGPCLALRAYSYGVVAELHRASRTPRAERLPTRVQGNGSIEIYIGIESPRQTCWENQEGVSLLRKWQTGQAGLRSRLGRTHRQCLRAYFLACVATILDWILSYTLRGKMPLVTSWFLELYGRPATILFA